MGVYIEGMAMPKGAEMLVVFSDGMVHRCLPGIKEELEKGTAVPVPPHGDLIDRGELKRQGYFFPCAIGAEYAIPLRALREAPTIIPAEEAQT